VCPEEAISKDPENGVVIIDTKKCIGCKSCIAACPYTVPQFIEAESIVDKCDFCSDLLAKGENPVCIDSCPQFALEYGDIKELTTKHSAAVADLPALPSSSQTGPSAVITPRPSALVAGFREKHI
jgi:anaerobic dimethyl sulfoxide reductase subunit B (iron-sulfur subunit)